MLGSVGVGVAPTGPNRHAEKETTSPAVAGCIVLEAQNGVAVNGSPLTPGVVAAPISIAATAGHSPGSVGRVRAPRLPRGLFCAQCGVSDALVRIDSRNKDGEGYHCGTCYGQRKKLGGLLPADFKPKRKAGSLEGSSGDGAAQKGAGTVAGRALGQSALGLTGGLEAAPVMIGSGKNCGATSSNKRKGLEGVSSGKPTKKRPQAMGAAAAAFAERGRGGEEAANGAKGVDESGEESPKRGAGASPPRQASEGVPADTKDFSNPVPLSPSELLAVSAALPVCLTPGGRAEDETVLQRKAMELAVAHSVDEPWEKEDIDVFLEAGIDFDELPPAEGTQEPRSGERALGPGASAEANASHLGGGAGGVPEEKPEGDPSGSQRVEEAPGGGGTRAPGGGTKVADSEHWLQDLIVAPGEARPEAIMGKVMQEGHSGAAPAKVEGASQGKAANEGEEERGLGPGKKWGKSRTAVMGAAAVASRLALKVPEKETQHGGWGVDAVDLSAPASEGKIAEVGDAGDRESEPPLPIEGGAMDGPPSNKLEVRPELEKGSGLQSGGQEKNGVNAPDVVEAAAGDGEVASGVLAAAQESEMGSANEAAARPAGPLESKEQKQGESSSAADLGASGSTQQIGGEPITSCLQCRMGIFNENHRRFGPDAKRSLCTPCGNAWALTEDGVKGALQKFGTAACTNCGEKTTRRRSGPGGKLSLCYCCGVAWRTNGKLEDAAWAAKVGFNKQGPKSRGDIRQGTGADSQQMEAEEREGAVGQPEVPRNDEAGPGVGEPAAEGASSGSKKRKRVLLGKACVDCGAQFSHNDSRRFGLDGKRSLCETCGDAWALTEDGVRCAIEKYGSACCAKCGSKTMFRRKGPGGQHSLCSRCGRAWYKLGKPEVFVWDGPESGVKRRRRKSDGTGAVGEDSGIIFVEQKTENEIGGGVVGEQGPGKTRARGKERGKKEGAEQRIAVSQENGADETEGKTSDLGEKLWCQGCERTIPVGAACWGPNGPKTLCKTCNYNWWKDGKPNRVPNMKHLKHKPRGKEQGAKGLGKKAAVNRPLAKEAAAVEGQTQKNNGVRLGAMGGKGGVPKGRLAVKHTVGTKGKATEDRGRPEKKAKKGKVKTQAPQTETQLEDRCIVAPMAEPSGASKRNLKQESGGQGKKSPAKGKRGRQLVIRNGGVKEVAIELKRQRLEKGKVPVKGGASGGLSQQTGSARRSGFAAPPSSGRDEGWVTAVNEEEFEAGGSNEGEAECLFTVVDGACEKMRSRGTKLLSHLGDVWVKHGAKKGPIGEREAERKSMVQALKGLARREVFVKVEEAYEQVDPEQFRARNPLSKKTTFILWGQELQVPEGVNIGSYTAAIVEKAKAEAGAAVTAKRRGKADAGAPMWKRDPNLPDEERCMRSDGRGWRCGRRRAAGFSMCEHHVKQPREREALRGKKSVGKGLKLKGKEGAARGLLLKAKGGARVRGLKMGTGAGSKLAVLQRLKNVQLVSPRIRIRIF